jgi:hypothetical protein
MNLYINPANIFNNTCPAIIFAIYKFYRIFSLYLMEGKIYNLTRRGEWFYVIKPYPRGGMVLRTYRRAVWYPLDTYRYLRNLDIDSYLIYIRGLLLSIWIEVLSPYFILNTFINFTLSCKVKLSVHKINPLFLIAPSPIIQ